MNKTIDRKEKAQTSYEMIPEDEWLALTDEFIKEHRPALEALAK
jgi:hypothetical protein